MELKACRYHAIELCFESKTEKDLKCSEISASRAAGKFIWLDIEVEDFDRAMDSLRALDMITEEVLEDAAEGIPATQCNRFEKHLNVVVADVGFEGDDFVSRRVDIIIGEDYIVTLRTGEVKFLEQVKSSFSEDFRLHARSPSFLIYEFWDHLIDHYVRIQNEFELKVESIQKKLFQKVGDEVFTDVSGLGGDLLEFRKLLLPARSVLTELSSRRSKFISEATQPYLGNMVGSIETVLQDLLVDRDILSESLHLYMSMVSHRTNSVMRKLTVVSVIFLPLTFLVGVYGMNFERIPELKWEFGYLYFWIAALIVIIGGLAMMKRNDLL